MRPKTGPLSPAISDFLSPPVCEMGHMPPPPPFKGRAREAPEMEQQRPQGRSQASAALSSSGRRLR